MESKDIEQVNKFIAEFMEGVMYKKPQHNHCFRQAPKQIPIYSGDFLTIDEMKYHSSWDWLMPVVEKISRIKIEWENATIQDTYYPRTFGMLSPEGKVLVRINSSQLFEADTLIEATWLAVIDFIKWFNTQSSNLNKNTQ